MKHQVGLVTYESTMHSWVLDLPGCVTGARDAGELDGKLPLAIIEHEAWLRKHGEAFEPVAGWEIVETVDGLSLAATGGEFCFQAERAPLACEDLERGVARMEYARSDLMAAIEALPDAVLDWAPPASAYASFDAWAPGVRTIREIVTHDLQLEVYYRDGLRDGLAKGILERVEDPATERQRTIQLLRSLDDRARSRVYRPVRPSRDAAEDWTARKVLRRIISHERMHTAEISQRLAWLLLGAPVVRAE